MWVAQPVVCDAHARRRGRRAAHATDGLVTEVADIEAIKRLKARYFRMMDTKDWDGFAAVFCDDVEVDVRDDGAGVSRGAERFVAGVKAAIGDALTVHHGHTPEITLTSSTTATGIWAMEDRVWWPPGRPLSAVHGFGHYHETYEKTADGWRIKSMTLRRLDRVIEPGRD